MHNLPLALFTAIAIITVVSQPRQDSSPRALLTLVLLSAGTLIVYWAANPWLLLAGYLLATLPFVDRRRPLSSTMLVASSIAFAGAFFLKALPLLIAVIVLRKAGTTVFDHRPLGTAALLFNGHLGAFLMMRLPADAPDRQWFPLICTLALVAAVLVAVSALAETRPRRVLALVATSQAGFILAGLASSTPEGVRGALVQWIVVGLASTGLLTVCRLIEVRYGDVITGREHLGLAERFPRLAVFFVVCALAMVGLPGTLGFFAEDLLVHGLMDTHPYIGILQPLAAALNAITLLRLFSILFLGRRVSGLELVPDALPRERWPLAALVVLLVIGGLAPGLLVRFE